MDFSLFTALAQIQRSGGPTLDAPATTSQFVLLILAALGLTVVMIFISRRWRRSHEPKALQSMSHRRAEEEKGGKAIRDLKEVIGELDQLASQVHGRMDTRFAKLEAVIRDADQRIETLSRLIRSADGNETLDITLSPALPEEKSSTAVVEAESPHCEVYRLADVGMTPLQIAEELKKTAGEIELILSLRRARTAGKRLTDSACPKRSLPV